MNTQKIDWNWILEHMRLCNKCNCYKVLDNFEGKKQKCKTCAPTLKKPKKTIDPKPITSEEYHLHQNINKALTGYSKIPLIFKKNSPISHS